MTQSCPLDNILELRGKKTFQRAIYNLLLQAMVSECTLIFFFLFHHFLNLFVHSLLCVPSYKKKNISTVIFTNNRTFSEQKAHFLIISCTTTITNHQNNYYYIHAKCDNLWSFLIKSLDCEQSLLFIRFSEGSAHACGHFRIFQFWL